MILDIHLGGMSGLELLSQLRASGNALTAVIITAHDDPHARAESRRLGCAAYLRKPFEASELLKAVFTALGREDETSAGSASPGGKE
jgi:DNA-binding response OmpR family regulator